MLLGNKKQLKHKSNVDHFHFETDKDEANKIPKGVYDFI